MDYARSLTYNLNLWSDLLSSPSTGFIPDMDGVVDFGRKSCDQRFPGCKLLDFAETGIMSGNAKS